MQAKLKQVWCSWTAKQLINELVETVVRALIQEWSILSAVCTSTGVRVCPNCHVPLLRRVNIITQDLSLRHPQHQSQFLNYPHHQNHERWHNSMMERRAQFPLLFSLPSPPLSFFRVHLWSLHLALHPGTSVCEEGQIAGVFK